MKRNACGRLIGKPVGKETTRKMDNIKMVLREIVWGGMDSIVLAQDRDQWRALVNTEMNLPVPLNAGKFLSSCTAGGSSRKAQFHGVSY
jgi:hypothetical protein